MKKSAFLSIEKYSIDESIGALKKHSTDRYFIQDRDMFDGLIQNNLDDDLLSQNENIEDKPFFLG